MKNNCEIIQDLIPLYLDGCASASSASMVEEHIDQCRECRAFAASYRRASKITSPSRGEVREIDLNFDEPFCHLAKKIRIRRRISTACSIGAVIAGAMILTFVADKINKA